MATALTFLVGCNDNFLNSDLENITTDADIELAKHGLVASLLKRPDTLGAEGSRIWIEALALKSYALMEAPIRGLFRISHVAVQRIPFECYDLVIDCVLELKCF